MLLQDSPRGGIPFFMTKVATGLSNQRIVDMYIGGDYARWSYAYPWMLKYLDERYRDIIGHQGLTRVVDQFPEFALAIEEYLQRDQLRELVDGNFVKIEGLEFSPWDAFAFIDNSIDDCNVAYAGPRGDYPGAVRREEYADAQQALYSGYTHRHGIRVETCFRPDGICTVFGPVSARHHDASVLRTSNLNSFLYELQLGRFTTTDGNPVFYTAFGDWYHRPFGAGAPLTDEQNQCNRAMKSARMVIEKNYGQMANIFRICGVSDNYRLAKINPYAVEQYRICIFLTNCYMQSGARSARPNPPSPSHEQPSDARIGSQSVHPVLPVLEDEEG